MATITLHAGCCEKGREFLQFIPKDDCRINDIDPEVGAFYMNVNTTYPDPCWERIHYCPFCGKELAVPLM